VRCSGLVLIGIPGNTISSLLVASELAVLSRLSVTSSYICVIFNSSNSVQYPKYPVSVGYNLICICILSNSEFSSGTNETFSISIHSSLDALNTNRCSHVLLGSYTFNKPFATSLFVLYLPVNCNF